MALVRNDEFQLEITALTSEGSGVGRVDGMAVFVPGTCPGDIVLARAVKVMPRYAHAIVRAVVRPGPGRVPPDCSSYPACGGCTLRHIGYEEELAAKEGFVRDAMARIGGVQAPVLPIVPSPQQNRYRNKAVFPLTMEDGAIVPAFYAPRSHRPVPCRDCLLHPVLLNDIAGAFCALATQNGLTLYDEATGRGLLRSLFLRMGTVSGEVMVCAVVNGNALPGEQDMAEALCRRFPAIASFLLCENRERTNVALRGRFRTLAGQDYINDTLCGVPVRLTAQSFYQVNHDGAQTLYAHARAFAGLTGNETVLDLYCGAGTIGLSMARDCAALVGVEIVESAVEMARANAAAMGLSPEKARFICADAGQAAADLSARGLRPHVVLLDPPRKGCDNATLSAVVSMSPEKIVMVSCEPSTAARDVALLEKAGYRAEKIQPVDMFPRTRHVEQVVLLSRGSLGTAEKPHPGQTPAGRQA